ncbi:MAG: RNA-binding protein [Armatimonadota bacterium]
MDWTGIKNIRRTTIVATKSLYVGNLPYSTNEADLMQLFETHNARSARIIEGRGFGFVDVEADSADAAIEATNGKDYNGRTLVVNEARPRSEGGGGGGGRGGGGYGGRSGGRRY